MTQIADQILVFVLLLNFVVLGSSRLAVSVRIVAIQGIALGLLPAILHHFSVHLSFISFGMVAVKGFIIPLLLTRAVNRLTSKRESDPFVGHIPTLVVGGICTALSFAFAGRLPLAPEHQGLMIVPAAISTLLAGLLVIVTRRKAVSQVIGYLLLENGIFIFGQLLTTAMPFMVEAGVLLDLLVGIFVMGIIIGHIRAEFSSVDTSRLTTLRDV
ncbi:hydrogenase [Geobacter pelophilus]|uniref:Hydrogenase n=1 Tax=Geoanaerobacter pelophilus TaxID=60036 RepID=A0AAW4LCR9_9BACT|nr:hydrogenase [Geoanaerobacter pelophilus]MBT0665814.1 hydrogenase [Geoanaerobacter pelophilus]